MQYRTWISLSVMLSGMLLLAPLSVRAQENAPSPSKKESCPMCEQHMKDKPTDKATRVERQQRHERMEAMHQEMNHALQQQLTALRDHAKTMDGVSDQSQLLSEMKKHQQMTDTLLGTMIEQHHKMHTMMQEHHTHMHNTRVHEQQTPESTTEPQRPDSQK